MTVMPELWIKVNPLYVNSNRGVYNEVTPWSSPYDHLSLEVTLGSFVLTSPMLASVSASQPEIGWMMEGQVVLYTLHCNLAVVSFVQV